MSPARQSGPADGAAGSAAARFSLRCAGRSTRSSQVVNAAGLRTIVPYLRGYGGTRFLSADTPRSGEQAALGQDLLELLDALGIRKAVLAGYDWGGRAACVVSALWPERVAGLVSCSGYNIQDIAEFRRSRPIRSRKHGSGISIISTPNAAVTALPQKRREICRLLWKMWSPTWAFDDATFDRTRRLIRQSGFRRRRHSFVPAPDRQRRRRSALRVH